MKRTTAKAPAAPAEETRRHVAAPTIESLQARVAALEAAEAEREDFVAYMDTLASALFRCTALEAFEQHKADVAARIRDQETPHERGYSAKWGQPR